MPQTNLYSVTVPLFIRSLKRLDTLLDVIAAEAAKKALPHIPAGAREAALLGDRLVFDQFELKRQIQITCDNAKNGAARLAGIEAPKMDDTEQTVAELKERVAKTLEFVTSITPEQIAGREDERVSLPYWDGKSLSAFEYATFYLVPNFLFHFATAYSIIRKNGIEVGKGHFINDLPLK